jgi:hypothetical protein
LEEECRVKEFEEQDEAEDPKLPPHDLMGILKWEQEAPLTSGGFPPPQTIDQLHP